jgi:hypothetical protein
VSFRSSLVKYWRELQDFRHEMHNGKADDTTQSWWPTKLDDRGADDTTQSWWPRCGWHRRAMMTNEVGWRRFEREDFLLRADKRVRNQKIRKVQRGEEWGRFPPKGPQLCCHHVSVINRRLSSQRVVSSRSVINRRLSSHRVMSSQRVMSSASLWSRRAKKNLLTEILRYMW